MRPIPANFDGMNSGLGYPKMPSNLCFANVVSKKKLNCFNGNFIKFGVAVSFALVSFIFYVIFLVFRWRSVAQVRYGIVILVPVLVAHNMAAWSITKKCFSHHDVYVADLLSFILFPLLEGHAAIGGCLVYFSQEPFPVSDGGEPAKAANLIDTLVSTYGLPSFGVVGHG